MIPVAVDGLVVVTAVVAAVARHGVARAYSWFLLVAGTVASVAGNAIHAWKLTHSPIGVGITILPAPVTLAVVHLTILLARQGDEVATAPVRDIEPEPIRVPFDEDNKRDGVTGHSAPSCSCETCRQRHGTWGCDATDNPFVSQHLSPMRQTQSSVPGRSRCVISEGKTIRVIGAELGIAKDKVQGWLTAHRRGTQCEVVAGRLPPVATLRHAQAARTSGSTTQRWVCCLLLNPSL